MLSLEHIIGALSLALYLVIARQHSAQQVARGRSDRAPAVVSRRWTTRYSPLYKSPLWVGTTGLVLVDSLGEVCIRLPDPDHVAGPLFQAISDEEEAP